MKKLFGSKKDPKDIKATMMKMKKNKDVKGLIKMLSHEDMAIRLMAVVDLGAIGDERAIKPLQKVLNDRESAVRNSAVLQLLGFGLPLESLISSFSDREKLQCLYFLKNMDEIKKNKEAENKIENLLKDYG